MDKKYGITYRNEIKQIFSILIFPIILFGIIGPLEIYVGNIQEFNFGIEDFIGYFFLISVILLVIAVIMLYYLPHTITKMLLGTVFISTLLAYFQNLLMNTKLIEQDGSRMEWEKIHTYSTVNLMIWIVLFIVFLVLFFVSNKYMMKFCQYASLFLTCVQVVAVISLVLTSCSYDRVNNHFILSGVHQYNLAKNENIVVILLDRYANTEFEKLLDEKPEVQETLKDFTYYNNADSHYNYTFPSLVHILTGEELSNVNSRDEWTKEIWNSESCINFYKILHENGFRCNLYSDLEAYVALGDLQNIQGRFDNIIQCEPRIDKGLICRLLEKMTLYKYAPYVLKPAFEVDYNVFSQTVIYDLGDGSVAYENSDFYERLLMNGLTIDETVEKQYSFIHLNGLHGPYHTGKDGTFVDDSDVPTTRIGINVMINEFLNQLKEVGIYDNTAIIIMSDHGMDISKLEPQPIFLIKNVGEVNANMQVNSAPISYDDFPATILSIANINHSGYGTSIFDWNESDYRERETLYPVSNSEMHKYIYSGNRDDLVYLITNDLYEVYQTNFNCEWVSLP